MYLLPLLILMFTGFALLIKGADLLIEGSSSPSSKMNVSQLVIGLTIVAFRTSAPELIVNVFAAVEGAQSVGLGNVVGSNTINILLILGVAALI